MRGHLSYHRGILYCWAIYDRVGRGVPLLFWLVGARAGPGAIVTATQCLTVVGHFCGCCSDATTVARSVSTVIDSRALGILLYT